MARKLKILVAVPNGDSWIHKIVAMKVIALIQDQRYQVTAIFPTWKPYAHNWHRVINDAIDVHDVDFLLSMDDDNPPKSNPLDLVVLDKDIIGCPTPVWNTSKKGGVPYYFNALDIQDDGWTPHKIFDPPLQEVDAHGSGCLLIARRVLDSLRHDQPFQRVWNPDGTVEIGGDYSFCMKAKQKGFKIWTHYNYPCEHFNELPLTEVISAFLEMKQPSA